MSLEYPEPPWQTVGRAFFQPFLVPARSLRIPAELEAEVRFGYATGLLGFVEYLAPSPLTYRELFWMPCRVRARADGKLHRGFYVKQMVVDSEASVAGGRQLWSLPKTLATFRERGGTIEIDSEAGARFALRARGRGPSIKVPTRASTLQLSEQCLISFRSRGHGQMRSASFELTECASANDWCGLSEARRLPGAATELTHFETTMLPAQSLRLDA